MVFEIISAKTCKISDTSKYFIQKKRLYRIFEIKLFEVSNSILKNVGVPKDLWIIANKQSCKFWTVLVDS